MRIAINGFGRIGRISLRALLQKAGLEVVAINDLSDTATLAHLFKYDSVHRGYPGQVSATSHTLTVDGKSIQVFAQKEPKNLPWKELNIDLVIESTGRFTSKEGASQQLIAGAKQVIISAPSPDPSTPYWNLQVPYQ